MKNKIDDLRNHLFATLEGLMDEENPMDLGRAQAVALIGQTLINSAKAETEFLRVTMSEPSTSFIALARAEQKALTNGKGNN